MARAGSIGGMRLPSALIVLCLVPVLHPAAGETSPRRTSAELTAEDRAWWSLQPVKRPEVPSAPDGVDVRTPVDAFLFASAASQGKTLPPELEKSALLRRVSFDLTGLPPTPEEREAFLADTAPDAWERLVDSLLASPRYGEKWARHWLDLVRWAESDGYKQDAFRPQAWRFRDWVVASLNADKPYDRFVQEQIAGDVLFPGDPDALVATGFHRSAVYEYNNRDAKTQWANLLAEATDTVGDAFLGLSVQCARCHNHKFDAIQQEDYFRLQACFSGMIWRDDQSAAGPAQTAAWQSLVAAWEARHGADVQALAAFEAPFRQRIADSALDKFPKELEAIWRRGEAAWTAQERPWMDFVRRQIDEELANVSKVMKPDEKKRWRELKDAVELAEKERPAPLPAAITVGEMPSAADVKMPGRAEPVAPGFLTVLGGENAGAQPRADLARWLTRAEHPLTARVMVNRVWQEHFGRGLVETPSDFGRLGAKPCEPELLDWLASEFVAGGWKLKRLHRLIVTSTAYRLAAGGDFAWRAALPRRLAAEQIRDATLAVSGELKHAPGGPSVSSDQPRRTIHTKALRNTPDPLLQSFDAPDAFRSTGARQNTTTATQSLLLVNGQWMQRRSQALAGELRRLFPGQSVEQVRHAWLRATGQEPTSEQIAEALAFVQAQADSLRAQAAPPAPEAAFAETRDLPRHGMALVVSAANAQKRLFPIMKATDAAPTGEFTVEAVVSLGSLWPDGTVRTIAAQWNGDAKRPGWALGVTGKGSRFTPGTLIFQVTGADSAGQLRSEAVPSGLAVPLNRPWFVAASFSAGKVVFVARDLGDVDSAFQMATVSVPVVDIASDAREPVVFGARSDSRRSHAFDGFIGEARLTARALALPELLGQAPVAPDGVVGHWKFDMAAGPLADDSPANHPLEIPAPPDAPDPDAAALADYCHVLLNSNAFLYVD